MDCLGFEGLTNEPDASTIRGGMVRTHFGLDQGKDAKEHQMKISLDKPLPFFAKVNPGRGYQEFGKMVLVENINPHTREATISGNGQKASIFLVHLYLDNECAFETVKWKKQRAENIGKGRR